MRRTVLFLACIIGSGFALAGEKSQKCEALYQLTDAYQAVEPGLVMPASADTPEHCQVNGVIDGTIRFQVSMPLKGWTGRLMYNAPSGLAGIIGDPRKCTLDLLNLDGLTCEGAPAANCLTEGQVETAQFFYTGITDESGNVVVPGNYPGSELGGDFELWVTGNPAFMPQPANDLTATVIESVMHRTPGFSLEAFDTLADLEELGEVMHATDIPEPDFSEFHANGGKLIIYNGWNDHPCRARVLEEFHFNTEELNGKEKTDEFLRTFMVPGMVHCIGGPGAWSADYVQAIVDWVENDKAPDRVIAEHPGELTFIESSAIIAGREVSWAEVVLEAHLAQHDARRFSRPLCPYPQYAQYKGSGSPDEAENFECVED